MNLVARLEYAVHPRAVPVILEYLDVGEITEATRSFGANIQDVGWSDEEIDRYANELEDILKHLQTLAPFVYYEVAVESFRRNARSGR